MHTGQIQREHSVWVTPEIAAQLDSFGSAVRKIGSTSWLHERDPKAAFAGNRIEQMEDLFSDVVELNRDGDAETVKEIAIDTILERAREVLGVSQLIALHKHLLALRGVSGDGV